MKKIYFAALALALTACVSNEDLNPVDNYGYIDLNVSNDPIVETRATRTGENINSWNVEVKKDSETKYTGTVGNLANRSFAEGENYSLTVYSCTEAEAIKDYGQARWEGSTTQTFSVVRGVTSPVSIYCGAAKNSKVGATFSLTNNFSNYKITLDPTTRNLDIKDATTFAYFPAVTLSFKFTYDYTDPSGQKFTGKYLENSITCVAGKLHLINIQSDENGKITLTLNYEDFTEGNGKIITFNAATGEKVSETNTTPPHT